MSLLMSWHWPGVVGFVLDAPALAERVQYVCRTVNLRSVAERSHFGDLDVPNVSRARRDAPATPSPIGPAACVRLVHENRANTVRCTRRRSTLGALPMPSFCFSDALQHRPAGTCASASSTAFRLTKNARSHESFRLAATPASATYSVKTVSENGRHDRRSPR